MTNNPEPVAHADGRYTPLGAAIIYAQKEIARLRAEIARKDEALRNIKALAIKAQAHGGPNGNLAHVEGFARAALKEPNQ